MSEIHQLKRYPGSQTQVPGRYALSRFRHERQPDSLAFKADVELL